MPAYYSPDASIRIRLDFKLLTQLNEACATVGANRSTVIRQAIREFLALYMPEEGVSVLDPRDV